MLTPGKIRGLTATSTQTGIFAILALDHRDAMRLMLDADDPSAVSAAHLVDTKLWLLRALGSDATAVILDPEYSAAQAIAKRALPGTTGFLTAIEAQGYGSDPHARRTALLEGWSVEKAKRVGASGIKLLVPYRPDSPVAAIQEELIRGVIADCSRHDIALFLEPLSYVTEPGVTADSPEYTQKRRQLVVETVRRLGPLGPDVLKLQFPVDTRHEPDRDEWADACLEVDEACPVPWALLSGGDPFELFRDQVRIACAAGASGFLAGRALWGEAIAAPAGERAALVESTLRPRFLELASIAMEHGRDWSSRLRLPEIDTTWYQRY